MLPSDDFQQMFALRGAEVKNKLYYGAAWYPELWSEEVLEQDILLMKETGINLVRIGEFIWSALEPEEDKIVIRPFVKYIERLHRNGIDTVMCTPTPTPPSGLPMDILSAVMWMRVER